MQPYLRGPLKGHASSLGNVMKVRSAYCSGLSYATGEVVM